MKKIRFKIFKISLVFSFTNALENNITSCKMYEDFIQAVWNGNLIIIQQVIVNIKNDAIIMYEAIDIAAKRGHMHIVLYLLDILLN